jgi:anthranilate phosphoribosyltransferase
MITPQQALARLLDNNELFHDEMSGLMRQIMSAQVAPEMVAALLVALRMKVETVAEIAAAAGVMREFATPVPVAGKQHLVDIVGTGGDGAHTFNISSTAMFVAAAAGAKVAKHGGRSVSSSSGAADVMEQMGVSLGLSPEKVGQCIEETGMGFMFAPNHHSSMRHVAPVRKALGVKTVFNILGPLTNPAAAPNQVLGVFHVDLVGILSRVLQQLGAEHVLVVHGSDGLDEITLTGQSRVAELKNGEISEYSIHPEAIRHRRARKPRRHQSGRCRPIAGDDEPRVGRRSRCCARYRAAQCGGHHLCGECCRFFGSGRGSCA